jgi:branched-chain amino acid transport system substrate-binding protein
LSPKRSEQRFLSVWGTMDMKISFRRIVFLFATLVLTSCAPQEPAKIGFLAGITGKSADVGTYARDGVILAVEERNAAGGIRGRLVELEIRDDGQDARKVKAAVHDLADNEVYAIIGCPTSQMSIEALPEAESRKVLMVSPSAMTDNLLGKNDLFVRLVSSCREHAAAMADHLRDKMGITTCAAVCDLGNQAYTEHWVNDFKDRFEEKGGRVLAIETFTSAPEVQFLPIAKRLAGLRTEAILVSGYPFDTAMICQQLRKIGWKGQLAITEWAASEKFFSLGGPAVEGVLVAQFCSRDSTDPRYKTFVDAYRKRFQSEPGYLSILGYDAANVLMDALDKSNFSRGEALRGQIIRTGSFQGVQERITIDEYGDAKRENRIAVVRNGKYNGMK